MALMKNEKSKSYSTQMAAVEEEISSHLKKMQDEKTRMDTATLLALIKKKGKSIEDMIAYLEQDEPEKNEKSV